MVFCSVADVKQNKQGYPESRKIYFLCPISARPYRITSLPDRQIMDWDGTFMKHEHWMPSGSDAYHIGLKPCQTDKISL